MEGDVAAAEQPLETHPPLVRVTLAAGRPPELVERVLRAVAETLARELRLEPGNVFVVLDEVAARRVVT
jgi:phenylpyruvate tautomerase PptA (4-oxalocrotonate tautomerase family)